MIIDLIDRFIGPETTRKIGSQIGADAGTIEKGISAALPLLLGGLTRNASSQAGAESLGKAIEDDHDGSIFDDLSGFLENVGAGTGAGAGILRHVFGEKQERIESAVSRSSGLDRASSAQLLQLLAPLVMGALGRVQRQKELGSQEVSGLLQTEMKSAAARGKADTSLLSILDFDGDGSALDDVSGMLGKLF